MGGEDPLEEGMATHSSVLTWRIPWTRGALAVHGVTEVRHNWSDLNPHQQIMQFNIKTQMDGRPKQTFLQRGYTDVQQTQGKMLNTTNY